MQKIPISSSNSHSSPFATKVPDTTSDSLPTTAVNETQSLRVADLPRNFLTADDVLDYLCIPMDEAMNKEKLVRIIRDLLKTDQDLDFLKELKKEDLERLVACIRDRIDH